jgi:hypothetical protein
MPETIRSARSERPPARGRAMRGARRGNALVTWVMAVLALALQASPSLAADTTPPAMPEIVRTQILNESKTLLIEHRIGIDYLRKSGLNLIIVAPSLEELRDSMRTLNQQGKVADASVRAAEEAVKAASPEERTTRHYFEAVPGFDPSTTLPRPFGIRTVGGGSVNVSERFMKRFQVTTEYDLYRVVRNASILITDFSGSIDEDTFKNHQARLMQTFDSKVLRTGSQDSRERVRAILMFASAIMALDSLMPRNDQEISADDAYYAAAIIGNRYQLF